MMNRRTCLALVSALALGLLVGPSPAQSAQEPELVVIAHPGVPVEKLGGLALEAIFTLADTTWANGERIIPLNYEPLSATRVQFDRAVLRMDPNQVARFWLERRIRGQGTSPRVAPTPELIVKVVSKLRGSIGYVPATLPLAGVKVVARVRNGEVTAP